MPDFTILCGDYSWKVHSHLFDRHSKAFKAIFQEGATKEWTAAESPVVVAHLILWVYTSGYGDLAGEADQTGDFMPAMTIDELMKHGLVRPSCADGSPGVLSPVDELFMPAEKEWVPDTLHAAIYLLASRYGIVELKEKAADEIDIILTELDWERTCFMPLLGELFGVKNGCGVEKSTKTEAGDHDGNPADCNGVEDNQCVTDTKPSAVAPAVRADSAAPVSLCPKNDAKVWNTLAEEAASGFDAYQLDPVFRRVMVNHPHFNWEVSTRLQKKFAETQTQLAKKEELIHGLAVKDAAKGKKGRKTKKEKEKEKTTG
ncbi:hypothetical protein A1O7_01874 [Cladophialophora yegresii CBS 114405]|uniref:BTB domain-containing protein n=1 Tax=Cladophialophora yegresii CBS 114405 TaxID=1182544 RepID=W9WC58_9EURO|nr:uncharacterized protein A1O7_01874 [Cladophialophora yegresii CBS 114405]EXJ65533.1 hypothetical protein A1O7_01874 [Cladophialophora yegresii CBS 114405]